MDVAIICAAIAIIVAIPPCIESIINLSDKRGERGRMNSLILPSGVEQTNTQSTAKQMLHKLSPYCILAFIIFGLVAIGLSCYKAYAAIQNEYQNIEPDQIIVNRNFINEEVILDGKKFVGCNFTRCRLTFLGKRPFSMTHGDANECVWWTPKQEIKDYMSALIASGILNTNKMFPMNDH